MMSRLEPLFYSDRRKGITKGVDETQPKSIAYAWRAIAHVVESRDSLRSTILVAYSS